MFNCSSDTSSLVDMQNVYLVLLFFLIHYAESNSTSNCSKKVTTVSYLDAALKMIDKVKANMPTCSDTETNFTRVPVDCSDILHMGHKTSGVYTIWPMHRVMEDKSIDVYCDMDTDGGGWTLIQRRGNYGRPIDFFFKDWQSYKKGFGDIQKDFWLGNENIFALTSQKLYSARFDLEDVKMNKAYAQYDYFWIYDEFEKYTLHIEDYSGDAGDSMIPVHNNQMFSTKDVNNENEGDDSCAELHKGGWWYGDCHEANLNGLYLRGAHESYADGVNWLTWRGYEESLEATEIKIRPKAFIVPKNI